MQDTARAAARFRVKTVTGFTGSSIWHAVYAFPPTSRAYLDRGFADFAARWRPILDTFDEVDVNFALEDYDLFVRPLWIDKALERLKAMLLLDLEIKVLDEQVARLARELRVTTQRVNLFEKVKIPETAENIRKIRIYLGDQQTAQVVRGKIAKRKVVERESA